MSTNNSAGAIEGKQPHGLDSFWSVQALVLAARYPEGSKTYRRYMTIAQEAAHNLERKNKQNFIHWKHG